MIIWRPEKKKSEMHEVQSEDREGKGRGGGEKQREKGKDLLPQAENPVAISIRKRMAHKSADNLQARRLLYTQIEWSGIFLGQSLTRFIKFSDLYYLLTLYLAEMTFITNLQENALSDYKKKMEVRADFKNQIPMPSNVENGSIKRK